MTSEELTELSLRLDNHLENTSAHVGAIYGESAAKYVDFSNVNYWHTLYQFSLDQMYSIACMEPVHKDHDVLLNFDHIDTSIENTNYWINLLEQIIDKHPNGRTVPHGKYDGYSINIAIANNYQSIFTNKIPLKSLMKNLIKEGKVVDEILFKLLLIDKTLITYSPIKNRVSEALSLKDSKFQKNLCNTLKKRTRRIKRKYPDLTYAVWYLLENNYYNLLSPIERTSILQKYYTAYSEPESFSREIDRIKKSLQT